MENSSMPQKSIQDDKFLNALAEAFRLQEAILNSTDFGIISTTREGVINSFNKASEDLLGYNSEEVIGKANPLLFHDLDEIINAAQELSEATGVEMEPVFDVFAKKVSTQNHPFKREWTLIRKDRTRFSAMISVSALRDEEGQLIGYVCITEDISERKKTAAKAAEAELQLEKIAEENYRVFNNPVNLNAIAGFDGFFKRLSPGWTEVLGWSNEELQTKPFIDFVHPDDIQSTINAVAQIRTGHNILNFENRYRTKDGTYRWLLWGSASDPNNQLIYASAIDITERKKSEIELLHSKKNLEVIADKLQEQNKQLDEFAHIISHNLRSPLGNIQALVNLLNDDSSIADYKLIFEKLKNLAKNLGETMNDLMDTLKVRTNTTIERYEIRFKDVLDKVVQTLEGDLIIAEASVTFDFNAAPTVYYPKAYIESIFQNLLTNSIKYRSPSRRPIIHFSSIEKDGRVELRVSDNGLGIDLERFGDKLFGLHKTFHIHDEARGVGLFLIRTQVQSMGGSIRAESEVDKGTTFIIRF
jgi:PAS domain S-box-containing protein